MAEHKSPAEGDAESFLARWSRRKQAVVSGATLDDPADAPAEQAACDEAEAATAIADEAADLELEENRKAAEAIDIESLSFGDDFSVFMRRGVPDGLRRLALRKLWRSNPVLANIDGLNDYDDDFTNPAHRVYSSIWEAGRGFLTDAEQAAQKATGRLTMPSEPAKQEPAEETSGDKTAEASSDEAAMPETLQLTDGTGSPPMEADPANDLAGATDSGLEPIAPSGRDSRQDAESPEPPRRVSIRQRLQG